MTEKQRSNIEDIRPGMKVEATEGDLGENDVSPARVTDVVRNEEGNVEAIEVAKGTIFHRKLEVPANRIAGVESKGSSNGDVKIVANEQELESLDAARTDWLSSDGHESQDSPLDQVERQIPTAEGLREMEANISSIHSRRTSLWQVLGPGFLAGMSGNDSSAVTAYAVDGASAGYGHLWLMLLSTPLYQAVQFACAKIGRISQKGLSTLLGEHYGRPVAVIVSLLLIVSNITLIAADLSAIGAGFELITGLKWFWFAVPVGAALWYLTVFRNFESLKKIFVVLSFAFVTYILTTLFSHADWGTVLVRTFVPQLSFDFVSISSAVALLGATFSPYSMFWQVQGEKEEKRPGSLKKQVRIAGLDVTSGVISGNLVAYFIIVCTSATLFAHHQTINTALDAARALEPLAGPLARYLFAVGLIGSGLIAIPILLASTSYTVAGTFGWPSGLSKRPWQNEGFYLILTAALVVGLIITLLGINPIQLIFWANVLAGVLAPLIVIAILLVGNNQKIMRKERLSLLNNIGLIITMILLIAGAVLLFYGLATGQSGS